MLSNRNPNKWFKKSRGLFVLFYLCPERPGISNSELSYQLHGLQGSRVPLLFCSMIFSIDFHVYLMIRGGFGSSKHHTNIPGKEMIQGNKRKTA